VIRLFKVLCRFLSWAGFPFFVVDCEQLSEIEIGKRERMVQTYIVFMGLLFTCDKDSVLQSSLSIVFFSFLVFSVLYYDAVSGVLDINSRLFIDLNAFLIGVCLSLYICALVWFFNGNSSILDMFYLDVKSFSLYNVVLDLIYCLGVICLAIGFYGALRVDHGVSWKKRT
jgi:hypothetical protein